MDWQPYPLQGPVYSKRLALVAQVGPSWAYRPYLAGGVARDFLTSTGWWSGELREQSWSYEIGAGVRGGDQLLPWFVWRWHRSFDYMGILGAVPLDYHTWGIGLGWN